MKKSLLLLCILILNSAVFSQNRYYVSFNAGYALGTTKDVLGTSIQTFASGDFKRSNIYGTFGKGLGFTLRGGSRINDNLSAELGFSYLLGGKVITDEASSPSTQSSTEVKGTQIRVLPSLRFSGKNEGLHLYGRIGLVLPVGVTSKSTQTTSGTDIGGNAQETILKRDRTNAFAIGYFGAIGVSIKIADNMQFFAEAEHISLRTKQKTAVLTDYTVNGSSQLESLTTQQKQTEYVDELTSSDNTKIDEPLRVRAITQNFSSIGLNFGIKLSF